MLRGSQLPAEGFLVAFWGSQLLPFPPRNIPKALEGFPVYPSYPQQASGFPSWVLKSPRLPHWLLIFLHDIYFLYTVMQPFIDRCGHNI